jgi:hypothetical protein
MIGNANLDFTENLKEALVFQLLIDLKKMILLIYLNPLRIAKKHI